VIVRRWERLAGKSALLASSGATFERTETLRTGWSSNVAQDIAA
jgi:hypothetical protein